ncbi:hypothetical protein [Bradyrhizobium sp. USDA 241]|uniref:hypothetical protein n=1 Tax=Bradyrhizobium sp. USDA 241 TaxID=3377725 RepID=UPI003C788648
MKAYTVIRSFFRNGIEQEVGAVIYAVEKEVKYLKHAVAEKVAEVAQKVEAAVAPVEPAPALGAEVTETPADGDVN